MNLATLKDIASGYDLTVEDRGGGHFLIIGPLRVGYWPDSKNRSAYVLGTRKAVKHVTPEQACKMATRPPPLKPGEAKRQSSYHRAKRRLLLKWPYCHWCATPLNATNATIEHIIPLGCGGLDNENNRTLACDPCNSKRGHAMPEIVGTK